jgi:branched-chain amino acid transport system permease protein
VNIVQMLILGLMLGGVYALMASGLTLLFGVMRVVNLAHGVFILLGAYAAFFLFDIWSVDPFVSMILVMPVMFAVGVGTYRLLFSRIEGTKRYGEMTVLLTFGIALVLEGAMGAVFTGIFRSTNPSYANGAILLGPLFIPLGQLYASLASAGLLVLLWLFLSRTKTGSAIRATMQNRTAAQIVGVNVRRVSMISFGIGISIAGASGALLSYLFAFFPARHWQWISILLSLVVLGGLGSLKGAVVGALSLAVLSSIVSTYLGPTWSPLTFYLALFLILLIRPQGLFGRETAI